MKATLDHIQTETENIRSFFFKPETELSYTSGQFTELTLEHKNPDSRGQKRWFTISSSPTNELVSITTKYAGDKFSSSFKKALFKLQPGNEVKLAEAMGDFVLPQLIQTPLIFVAGGIGITPFHSILEWLAAAHEERHIKMLYGVDNEDEIIFQESFTKADQHVTILVNQATPAWGGERGRLSAENIIGLETPSEDTLIYVAGPEKMVENLSNDLIAKGFKKSQLVLDIFPNYQT
jgi:ferredoxin-NADP reductase